MLTVSLRTPGSAGDGLLWTWQENHRGYGAGNEGNVADMMNDQTHAREFAVDTGSKAAEGAGVGADIGGTLGAIIAAVTATGSVAALATTGGLAAPLVAGPLAAALAGAGIPKDRAAQYETDLNAGGILVGVHASGVNAAEVQRILMSDGAVDVQGAAIANRAL